MTTEKEEYEFAAKAVGGLVYIDDMGWIEEDENGNRGKWWHPKDDDGDSRRLAVKLNIQIDFYRNYLKTTHYSDGSFYLQGGCVVSGDFPYGDDKCAAVRLAVWRAAVEIGRAMK